MTIRPPRILSRPPAPAAFDVLQHEILQEKAATLGRMAHALETALAALKNFEAGGAEGDRESERAALVDAAAQALWALTIHREILGLAGSRFLIRDYDVPPAVVARMGVMPAKRP